MEEKRIRIVRSAIGVLVIFIVFALGWLISPAVKAAEGDVATEPVYAGLLGFHGTRADNNRGGAVMQLLSADGEVLEEWTSVNGENHKIETPLLIGTTYVLHQVSPPEGYTEEYAGYWDVPAGSFDVDFALGYDTEFTIKEVGDTERVYSSWYEKTLDWKRKGTQKTQAYDDTVYVLSPRSRTLEIGKEVLGTAVDPDEYFEVILDIPKGVPGQVMHVDLTNADADVNPDQVVIPESGSLTTSFWLKGGQSVKLDGFPLYFADYYSVYENNEVMNAEGYITKILTAENMNQVEADSLIIAGIGLISKAEPVSPRPLEIRSASVGLWDSFFHWFSPLVVYAQDEVSQSAIDVMNGYACEELFAVEEPVVDVEDVPNPLFETLGGIRGKSFTVSDTLSDGAGTTRTASKRGDLPTQGQYMMLTDVNAVYGDGCVLFINRRDGVTIAKKDDAGNYVKDSELQILDGNGQEVHSFTTKEEDVMVIALAPGEYTLHEVSAPEGYEPAEDIPFTVIDQETVKVDGEEVEVITMIDKKKPEPETVAEDQTTVSGEKPTQPAKQDKAPETGDRSNLGLLTGIFAASAVVLLILGFSLWTRRRKNKNS